MLAYLDPCQAQGTTKVTFYGVVSVYDKCLSLITILNEFPAQQPLPCE